MKTLFTCLVTLFLFVGMSERSSACVDYHPDSVVVNILADTINCNIIIEVSNLNMFGGNPNDFCSCGITNALGDGTNILWVAFVDAVTNEPVEGFDLWGYADAAGTSWEDADPGTIDWNGFISNVNSAGIVAGQDVKLWIIIDSLDSQWSWVCGSDEGTVMEIFGQLSFGTDEWDNDGQELADTHQDITSFSAAWINVYFITPEEYQEHIDILENHYNSVGENEVVEFNMYPNPSSTTLHLNANGQVEQLIIRDMVGREVFTQKGKVKELEVSHLPNGMYIVQVEINGHLVTQNLQIRH